jgi:hypothetical protein
MDEPLESLIATLKGVSAALRDAGIPFAVAGGFAFYPRGGPADDKDIDLLLCPQDVDRAVDALAAAGFRPEDPPEEWLTKVWDGDNLVDLIFSPTGLELTRDVLGRAEELQIGAVTMPVMPLEDVLVTQLMSMDEHTIDNFGGLLHATRLVREQVDWDDVRTRTESSPFARAFFVLLEGLDIVTPSPTG